jgi:GDP-4-dehydro-6-deoxy-D-mannose reductase
MKKILITGITGFAGSFLAEHLLKVHTDCEIHGTYLSESGHKNISSIADSIILHQIDLTNAELVKTLIEKILPDEIYHLAALPSPAASYDNPALFIHNNVDVELNILEAMRCAALTDTKILIISSADVYGQVSEEDLPIDESTPFRPLNPYAVSKVAQDMLGLQYFLAHKLSVLRVRPFNHIGPRQSPDFVVSSFAKQIATVEKATDAEKLIRVGNLEARRDFTDVRDMVRAYSIIMEKGVLGEVYNIGSAQSYTMQEILDRLLKMANTPIEALPDPTRMRPSDIKDIVADSSKVNALGWTPEIPIETSVKDTLDYWRSII